MSTPPAPNVQGGQQYAMNHYSQRGCLGCKPCEGGAANVGRGAVLWTIGICTAGIGLLILPFFKRCQYCHHNAFMNAHGGTSTRR